MGIIVMHICINGSYDSKLCLYIETVQIPSFFYPWFIAKQVIVLSSKSISELGLEYFGTENKEFDGKAQLTLLFHTP